MRLAYRRALSGPVTRVEPIEAPQQRRPRERAAADAARHLLRLRLRTGDDARVDRNQLAAARLGAVGSSWGTMFGTMDTTLTKAQADAIVDRGQVAR